jgi:hypothetical protein
MKTVINVNKLRAGVSLYFSLIIGLGLGTAIGLRGNLTWKMFCEEFSIFHLIGAALGTMIGVFIKNTATYRIKITDRIVSGPKGYTLWNEKRIITLKREKGLKVKKGILGGWVLPTRIIQGKKKINLNPSFYSKKISTTSSN